MAKNDNSEKFSQELLDELLKGRDPKSVQVPYFPDSSGSPGSF